MPGGIDPHAHCIWPVPNPDGSLALTRPAGLVSRAALFGGTTTHHRLHPRHARADLRDAIEKRDADWTGIAACDCGLAH